MKDKPIRLIWNIIRHTKADRILFSYVIFVFGAAVLIWITEPTITTYGDALWYCYAVLTTSGFGDYTTTEFLPRVLSVCLSAYSMLALAIITGVVVNYYTQIIQLKNRETIDAFLDRLEKLPELSEEELKELSERVSAFRDAR